MSDAIKDYLNAIARYPLLTVEQEIQLGRRVARWRELSELDRPLSGDERRELRSGERARQRFIQSNLQLVVHVARKYDRRQNRSLELMDLIQEGNIGLARAVELFDCTRGYKFSTYAYWWIRQGITRALMVQDAIIRLPSSLHDLLYRLNRTAERLAHDHQREPTLSELAAEMAVPIDELMMTLRRAYRVTSLDQKVADGESVIADVLPAPCGEDDQCSEQLTALLACCSAHLDDTTEMVVRARHQQEPVSWPELQQRTGMSRLRLQQLHDRGLSRLRMLLVDPLNGTPLGQSAIPEDPGRSG